MERRELEEILSQDMSFLETKDLWIWGTGYTSQMYQEGFLRWKLYDKVCGYVDGNENKWGKEFGGKRVVAPSELKKDNAYVLICSYEIENIIAIKKQLDVLEIEYSMLDEIALKTEKENVLKSYDLFETKKSKALYGYLVQCKMQGVYPSNKSGLIDSPQGYFNLEKMQEQNPEDVFLDIGCYVGDTIEEFLDTHNEFRKIISFEPDEKNYLRAKENVEKYKEKYNLCDDKIVLCPYGVGDQDMLGGFENSGRSGSKFITNNELDGTDSVKIVSVDGYIKEKYTLLKADVESFEYKVLLGAKYSIKKWKPKLAICVYHNVFDFIELPIMIKKYVPEYKVNLFQYADSWFETVLYAWL